MMRSGTRLAAWATTAVFAAVLLAGCSGAPESAATDADCTPAATFDTISPGRLTVIAVNNMPKFSVAAEGTGPADGIDGQMVTRFAEENCLQPYFIPLSGPAATQAIQDGKGDLWVSGIVKSEERAKILTQTDTLTYDVVSIASKDGYSTIADIEGKTVGAAQGTAFLPALAETIGQDNIREYQNPDGGYQDLEAGRIDAFLAYSVDQMWYLESHPNSDLQVVLLDEDPDNELITGVRETNWPHPFGNDALTDAINAFFAEIREDGTLKETLEAFNLKDPLYLEGR